MTWLDYAVVGVFAVSVLLGAWRGLVREVISILGWVIAFLAANLLAGPLGPAMPQIIPTPEWRVAAAYAVVFIGSLILTSLAGLTSAPRQAFWRDSSSGPLLAQAAGLLKPLLPQTFAERLRYD